MSDFKKPKIRSEKHRRYVANKPCLITGSTTGVQSHHLLRVGGKGMGIKECDTWCVPLHHTIHSALHACGNEVAFFKNHGLDYEVVKEVAKKLCRKSPCKKINEA